MKAAQYDLQDSINPFCTVIKCDFKIFVEDLIDNEGIFLAFIGVPHDGSPLQYKGGAGKGSPLSRYAHPGPYIGFRSVGRFRAGSGWAWELFLFAAPVPAEVGSLLRSPAQRMVERFIWRIGMYGESV